MLVKTSPVVDEVEKLFPVGLPGAFVPHAWFNSPTFKTKKGHTNLLAINILADILYWHRPRYKQDEMTNEIVAKENKFKRDKFHKTYEHWAEMFGYSKRAVQEACYFLKRLNLINIEVRNGIKTESGLTLNNVTYFEPVVDNVRLLNFESKEKHPTENSKKIYPNEGVTLESKSPNITMKGGSHHSVSQFPPQCETNTEITRESSKENTNYLPAEPEFENFKTASPEKPRHSILVNPKQGGYTEKVIDSPLPSVENSLVPISGVVATDKSYGAEAGLSVVKFLTSRLRVDKRNRFLMQFKRYSEGFHKVLAHRIANGHFSQEALENVLVLLENTESMSILDMLMKLVSKQYTQSDAAIDLIRIITDSKINIAREMKGLREIKNWIQSGVTTWQEVEDCVYWMPKEFSGFSFTMSYTSVPKALQHFSQVRQKDNFGRYTGKNLQTMNSKSSGVNDFLNRDYDALAAEMMKLKGENEQPTTSLPKSKYRNLL